MSRPVKYKNNKERITQNILVMPTTQCWLWQLYCNTEGYGNVHIQRRQDGVKRSLLAHRLSYEVFKGSIPEGLVLDHLCKVRNCVNPDHLEAVSIAENGKRSPTSAAEQNKLKIYCPKDHLLINASNWKGYWGKRRYCKTCALAYQKQYYIKRRDNIENL